MKEGPEFLETNAVLEKYKEAGILIVQNDPSVVKEGEHDLYCVLSYDEILSAA